jgi:mannose-6-phosphate isomerase-like protein (cupin superfamily)
MTEAVSATGGFLPAAAGERVWFLGNLMTIKSGLAATDPITFIVADLHPGHAPPVHLHNQEDEAFYVLDGAARFRCGSQVSEAARGDCVFVPRGTPHAFRVGPQGARTIMFSTSPLLARFMAAGGRPAGEGTPPPSSDAELQRVSELAASFDMHVVGPPLP